MKDLDGKVKKAWISDQFYVTNPTGEGIYDKNGNLVFNWTQLNAILAWNDYAERLREGYTEKLIQESLDKYFGKDKGKNNDEEV